MQLSCKQAISNLKKILSITHNGGIFLNIV